MPGRKRYTRTEYDRLLKGFRETPGNYNSAARSAGCDYRMAKRAWEVGWPKYAWARPIREVVEEEAAAARAAVAARLQRERELADAEAEKARAAHVEVLTVENQILSGARKNVAAAFGVSARLVPAMDALAMHVRNLVLEPDGKTPKPTAALQALGIDADTALRIIGRYTLVLQRAFGVGHDVVQLRRTIDGLPNAVLGVQAADMTAEAAAEELEAQEEAIRLIKEEAALNATKGPVH